MTLVWAGNQAEEGFLEEWAASRIPHIGSGNRFSRPAVFGAVLSDRGNEVVATVIFHDYQPSCGTIQVSMASSKVTWAKPQVITDMLRYAFKTAGANKVWSSTPHTNERAIRFNVGIGFRKEATLRHHFGVKSHAVICSMLRPEYEKSRWFKG